MAPESTILVGWSVGRPAGRLDGQAGNRTSTAQLGLELGLSLAIKDSWFTHIFDVEKNVCEKTWNKHNFS